MPLKLLRSVRIFLFQLILKKHAVISGSQIIGMLLLYERQLGEQLQVANMRRKVMLAQAFLFLSFALFACGGGGTSGSADTMTITVSSPTGTVTSTYTEGSQGDLTPYLSSNVRATYIEIVLIIDPHNMNSLTNVHIVAVGDNTPQSYSLGGNSRSWIAYNINNQSYVSVLSSPSGTITISSIGNMGEKITGTFDAVVTSTSSTLNISGTFSVTRDN